MQHTLISAAVAGQRDAVVAMSETTRKSLTSKLMPAIVMAWLGLLVLAYRLHPALGAIALFCGWIALGAYWDWLRFLDDIPGWRSRHRFGAD